MINCGLQEGDEIIHDWYLQGKIKAYVSTDLDISAARSVPRLIIAKKCLRLETWQPNPFISTSRLVVSDLASFKGAGAARLRLAICSLDQAKLKQLSDDWLRARNDLVECKPPGAAEASLLQNLSFLSSCHDIVQAIVGALQIQQVDIELDWFLKESGEPHWQAIERALFAAFLYDHMVLFSSSLSQLAELDDDAAGWPNSCNTESKSKMRQVVKDLARLREAQIDRVRLTFQPTGNTTVVKENEHHSVLMVPQCPASVTKFITRDNDEKEHNMLDQVARSRKLNLVLLSEDDKKALTLALTVSMKRGKIRARSKDVLQGNILCLASANDSYERLVSLRSRDPQVSPETESEDEDEDEEDEEVAVQEAKKKKTCRRPGSGGGGGGGGKRKRKGKGKLGKGPKKARKKTRSFEDRHSDEFSQTLQAINDAKDPLGAGFRNFAPIETAAYISGIYAVHRHGWQSKGKNWKTAPLEEGDHLPLQKVTPLLSPFAEMTSIIVCNKDGGLPALAQQWFGSGEDELQKVIADHKRVIGSTEAKNKVKQQFENLLAVWRKKQVPIITARIDDFNKDREEAIGIEAFLDVYCNRARLVFEKFLCYWRPCSSRNTIAVASNIYFLIDRFVVLENDTSPNEEVEIDSEDIENLLDEANLCEEEDDGEADDDGDDGDDGDDEGESHTPPKQRGTASFKTKLDKSTRQVLREVSNYGLNLMGMEITSSIQKYMGPGDQSLGPEEGLTKISLKSEIVRCGGIGTLFGLPNGEELRIGKKSMTCNKWSNQWKKSVSLGVHQGLLKYSNRKRKQETKTGLCFGEACIWEREDEEDNKTNKVLVRFRGTNAKGEAILSQIQCAEDFLEDGLISVKEKGAVEHAFVRSPTLYRASIRAKIDVLKLAGKKFMNFDPPTGCSGTMKQKVLRQRLGNLASSINHVLFGLARVSTFGRSPNLKAVPFTPNHTTKNDPTLNVTKRKSRVGAVYCRPSDSAERDFNLVHVQQAIQSGGEVYVQLGNAIASASGVRDAADVADVRILLKSKTDRKAFASCIIPDRGFVEQGVNQALINGTFYLAPGRGGHFVLRTQWFHELPELKFNWPANFGQRTKPFRADYTDPGASSQTTCGSGAGVIALEDLFDSGGIAALLDKQFEAQSRVTRLNNAAHKSVAAADTSDIKAPSLNPDHRRAKSAFPCYKCSRGSSNPNPRYGVKAETKRSSCCRTCGATASTYTQGTGQGLEEGCKINWKEDQAIEQWIEKVGSKKAFQKLNKWKHRHLDLTRKINAKLDGFYRQYGAAIARDASSDLLFLPKLTLKAMKKTRPGTKRIRQLLQHLSLAKLDDAIRRACRRAGKKVVRCKEWATTIKRPFAIKVEYGNGEIEVYQANPIGPSKFQASETGLLVPRDFAAASHGIPASVGTSKQHRHKIDALRPRSTA